MGNDLLTPEEINQIYLECGVLNKPSLSYLNERLTEAQLAKAQKQDPELEKGITAIVLKNITEYYTSDGLIQVKIKNMVTELLALIGDVKAEERENGATEERVRLKKLCQRLVSENPVRFPPELWNELE